MAAIPAEIDSKFIWTFYYSLVRVACVCVCAWSIEKQLNIENPVYIDEAGKNTEKFLINTTS